MRASRVVEQREWKAEQKAGDHNTETSSGIYTLAPSSRGDNINIPVATGPTTVILEQPDCQPVLSIVLLERDIDRL